MRQMDITTMKRNKMNVLKNKLISNSGMSIGELMVAMLIVLLVTSGVASGMQLALNQYNRSMVQSESKLLYSTLKNEITSELSITDKGSVETEGDADANGFKKLKSFYAKNYTMEHAYSSFCSVNVDDDGNMTKSDTEFGELLLGTINADNSVSGTLLVPSKTYSKYGLKAKADVKYNEARGMFRVFLTVDNGIGVPPVDDTFDVLQFNLPGKIVGDTNTFTVTYEYGDGPLSGTLPNAKKTKSVPDITRGATHLLISNSDIPTEWGSGEYTIKAWREKGSTTKLKAGDPVTVTSDKRYVAVWSKSYPVIFHNGSDVTKTGAIDVEYGTSNYSGLSAPDTPTHSDGTDVWSFNGWYYDNKELAFNSRSSIDYSALISKAEEGVINLYAGYVANSVYTPVTSDSDICHGASDMDGKSYVFKDAGYVISNSLYNGMKDTDNKIIGPKALAYENGAFNVNGITIRQNDDPSGDYYIISPPSSALWVPSYRFGNETDNRVILSNDGNYLHGYAGMRHGDLEISTAIGDARKWYYNPNDHILWGQYFWGVQIFDRPVGVTNTNVMRWDNGNSIFKVSNVDFSGTGKVYLFKKDDSKIVMDFNGATFN